MQEFKSVGIIGFVDKTLVKETIIRLAKFLTSKGVATYVEPSAKSEKDLLDVSFCSLEEMGKQCDLIVVVGGDGSLLGAARKLVEYDVPLLGVNRGRLGFLTDIAPNELEQRVEDVLNGNYVASHRFLLEGEMLRDSAVVAKGVALNDVVLQPRGSIRMIEFTLKIEHQYVYTQRSDGLIVSTPTGSTAYALSGGGPIVHPDLQAINLVPINPHTLSSRPIVVNPDVELEIVIERNNNVNARVVFDGQQYMNAELGDVIRLRKKKEILRLLHPVEHDFYQTCRTKLNWASK